MSVSADPAAALQLTIVSGEQAGRTIALNGSALVIGRGIGTDVTLRDVNASRRHASIQALGDGTLELRDLGSANGTFVNGERIASAVLRGGEQVVVGETVLYVDGGGDEDSVDTRIPPAAAKRTADSAVVRALGSSAVVRALRADSAIRRLVIAPELKRTRHLTLAALGAAFAALLGLGGVLLFGGSQGIQDAVAKVERATVLVVPERDGQPNGNGSGWVYDARRGLIVTNAHVVNGGESFEVGVDGRLVPARVLAVAPCDDLAVLKVAPTAGPESIELGAQSALKLGDTVVAVGFPQSAAPTADLTSTAGVVSVVKTSYTEDALDVPHYPNVIQTDAAINPGNSGGPLVDLHGRLVGVNSAARTSSATARAIQGQGYAIGIDRVRQLLPGLAAGKSIGWMGASFRFRSEQQLAEAKLPSGILLDGAIAGSPADRAGLGVEGSILTAVNGRPTANTLAGWCAATNGIKSGETATLSVVPPGARKAEQVRVRFP